MTEKYEIEKAISEAQASAYEEEKTEETSNTQEQNENIPLENLQYSSNSKMASLTFFLYILKSLAPCFNSTSDILFMKL